MFEAHPKIVVHQFSQKFVKIYKIKPVYLETSALRMIFPSKFVSCILKNSSTQIFIRIQFQLWNKTGLSWNRFVIANFHVHIHFLHPKKQLFGGMSFSKVYSNNPLILFFEVEIQNVYKNKFLVIKITSLNIELNIENIILLLPTGKTSK